MSRLYVSLMFQGGFIFLGSTQIQELLVDLNGQLRVNSKFEIAGMYPRSIDLLAGLHPWRPHICH